MLKILKSIRNSLLILIVITVNVEAKNSKDVSNIKVQKKSNEKFKELTNSFYYFLNQTKLYGVLSRLDITIQYF